MWLDIIKVALTGGILCLDKTTIQLMVFRPVVTGPVIGFILNDPYTGLILGALVELLWIDRIPLGTYIPPNSCIATVLITASAILAGKELGYVSRELQAVSVILFLPFGILGQKMDTWIINTNETLSEKAVEAAQKGDLKGLSRRHLSGVLKTFFVSGTLIFISLIIGVNFLSWLFPLLPEKSLTAFNYLYFTLPVIGAAVALNTAKVRGAVPVFSGLLLVGIVIMEIIS